MSEAFHLTVSEEGAGERLDVFLTAFFPERSRTFIKKLIDEGQVQVLSGDQPVYRKCKASLIMKEEDRITLTIPPDTPLDVEPENIPLDILYEDDDLLVVNKPKHMVVHPAPGHLSGTLVNAVLYHCGDSLSGVGGVLRPGIVHRIDRDTTGSLIICKNDMAHRGIAAQLSSHSLVRIYQALLIGRLPEEEMVIDKPIGRSPSDRKKMAVVPAGSGKEARTHLKLLKYYPKDGISHVACRLETGRTHQIRVHTASVGHPVLGDEVYGGLKKGFHTDGQCLHAGTLNFIHPRSGEWISTEAPLPEYFEQLLKTLT